MRTLVKFDENPGNVKVVYTRDLSLSKPTLGM